jgi:ASC-1-like (ASCH) protein
MKEWSFPVALRWYITINNGSKRVEGRVPDPSIPAKDYSKITCEDILLFFPVSNDFQRINNNQEARFMVMYNRRYGSVNKMLEAEGLLKTLPGVNTIPEGVAIYHSFPGYENRVKLHGIHAIGFGKRIA